METGQFVADDLAIGLRLLIGLIVAIWVLWLLNLAFVGGLVNALGIRPRTFRGIFGILFAPFLHGDIDHITGNTVALFIRGGLILLTGVDNFVIVSLVAALTSGIGIWLFGDDKTVHIGISGVTYGYLGFLLVRGYVEYEVLPALLSLLTLVFYRDRLWGVFPSGEKMSWEGHLFGLLGGAAAAYFLRDIKATLPPDWLNNLIR